MSIDFIGNKKALASFLLRAFCISNRFFFTDIRLKDYMQNGKNFAVCFKSPIDFILLASIFGSFKCFSEKYENWKKSYFFSLFSSRFLDSESDIAIFDLCSFCMAEQFKSDDSFVLICFYDTDKVLSFDCLVPKIVKTKTIIDGPYNFADIIALGNGDKDRKLNFNEDNLFLWRENF